MGHIDQPRRRAPRRTARRDEQGASATEYGLIVSCTAVSLIAVTQAFGDALYAYIIEMTAQLF